MTLKNKIKYEKLTISFLGLILVSSIVSSAIPPVQSQLSPGEILVLDPGSQLLFNVDPSTGFRTAISDFGNVAQGPLGQGPIGMTIDSMGNVLVMDISNHLLVSVDPDTGFRTVISDFDDSGQGPLGIEPIDVIVDTSDNIFVVDITAPNLGGIFTVDRTTGFRTILSNFTDSSQGAIGREPAFSTIDGFGNLIVPDNSAGPNFNGLLLSINTTTGFRSVVSDFENPVQGIVADTPEGVTIDASGNILVTVLGGGTNNKGLLVSVDPDTGFRTVISDFGDSGQGLVSLGGPINVGVDASGNLLVTIETAGTNNKGLLVSVDPSTGFRTAISDFGNVAQGPLGEGPFDIEVVSGAPVETCSGLPATIVGTEDDDVIDGTSGDDVIVGLDGNDIINGKGGNDTICGNEGNDQLFGNGGSDTILGGEDADFIEGNDGEDIIFGDEGDDIISGKVGSDTIEGGGGDDLIFGDDGADVISGGDGNDTIEGGAIGDTISGDAGNDKLLGDAGSDTLDGGTNDPESADICVPGINSGTETNCEIIF